MSFAQETHLSYFNVDPIVKDASYLVIDDKLNLYFKEKYTPTNAETIEIKIYDLDNSILTVLSENKVLGDNYLTLDMASISLVANAKYRIEISSINQEKVIAYLTAL